MNYTHAKKVDVIYIDPPYNTGNKDFIFNDKYVDPEDGYRHSKWLSFMEKRLKLAKNLLKDTGVIFISIDDNEMAKLRMLMDSPDLFGESNFVANVIWKSKSGGAADSAFLAIDTEYILIYAKNIKKLVFTKAPKEHTDSEYKYKDHNFNSFGGFKIRRLDETGIRYSKTLDFPIYIDKNTIEITGEKIPTQKDYFYKCEIPNEKISILPGGKQNYLKKYTWRWSAKKILNGFKKGYLIFVLNKNNEYRIVQKQYEFFDTSKEELIKVRRTPYRNWIDFTNTTEGTIDLINIFHKKLFNYPKPVRLIKYLIKLHPDKNAIVLDFMAGTGTTGQAVLDLNKEDGGNRQFILCTNNENNICTDVCYPRIKKVIGGYKNLKGEKVEGLGGNLKYFKTELLDVDHISHVSDEQKIKLTYQSGEMIALREGTFIEVEKNEWWQIFRDGTKYTAIYFKEDKSKLNELVKKLGELKEKVVLYIFSWGKNEYKNEFTQYKNINVGDIPEPILDVYKQVNSLR